MLTAKSRRPCCLQLADEAKSTELEILMKKSGQMLSKAAAQQRLRPTLHVITNSEACQQHADTGNADPGGFSPFRRRVQSLRASLRLRPRLWLAASAFCQHQVPDGRVTSSRVLEQQSFLAGSARKSSCLRGSCAVAFIPQQVFRGSKILNLSQARIPGSNKEQDCVQAATA